MKPLNVASASHSHQDSTTEESSPVGIGQNDDTSETDERILTELEALSLSTVVCSDSFDGLHDAALNSEGEADSPQQFNSNTELLLFLARSGPSTSLQQDLLDLLHHREFDPKQVRQCCSLSLTLGLSLTCTMTHSDG